MKSFYHPGIFLKSLTSRFILWEYPRGEKKIYLTFDDGPEPGITTEIIRMLDSYDAKATFFVTGRNVAANPGLLKILKEKGHSIGNHTWNHCNGWKTSTRDYLKEVEACSQMTGTYLFRPPYGRIRIRQLIALREKNYKIVMWSLLAGDYEKTVSKEQLVKRINNFIKPGSIIVLHDSPVAYENCLFLLEYILRRFSSKGYVFSSIT